MDNPIENQLILLCASRNKPSSHEKLSTLLNSPINWDYVIEQANNNHALPLVHVALSHLTIADQTKQLIQQDYLMTTQHNMRLSVETIRIVKLLNHQDIETIPYKGPIQSLIIYNDLSKRSSTINSRRLPTSNRLRRRYAK